MIIARLTRKKPRLWEVLRPFKTLLPAFRRHALRLALGLFFLLLVDFLLLQIPLIIKNAVDALTTLRATTGLLTTYAGAIVGIAAAIACFRFLWRYALLGHSRIVEENLRERLFSHLQQLSPSFYQHTSTGDVMARSINDLNAVRMAAGMGLVALADAIVLGTAAIGFMVHISPKLTLIAVIPMPVIVWCTRIMTRRMSSGYDSVQQSFSRMTERVREAFSGIRIIKAYAREPWCLERVREEGEVYVGTNLHLARTLALFMPLMAVFTNLGLGLVVWLGGRQTILDQITTGDFVAFTTYLTLLAWPMMALGWVINLLQRGSASMRRINSILETEPDIVSPPHPVPVPGVIQKGLRIEGLDFTHKGENGFSLKEIRLSINSGQTVAVVGRVGSGKTTLLQCFPRLIQVPEGSVYLDDLDITRFALRDLRETIGFVTQETILFSDTIKNNLLLGRKDIPDETLIESLRAAQFYEEMLELELGLDSLIGERGLSLSGGQRQRLTIARALVMDSRILILDDALSMVDTQTEENILNNILAGRSGKTTLFVSNRLSTISRADRIFVMKAGRLVEQGTHSSLIGLRGEYARIYTQQMLARELEQNGL